MDDKEWLLQVLQRLSKIEENTRHIDNISDIARKALSKSRANEKKLIELNDSQKFMWRTVVGIVVSVVVYLITQYLGG
ncbi:hemolysin XhlA family protein [Enterococcus sp.]|uniref:hemolysin XhlA family protein n=1 Tax=Enterococcus sp. TaxID=35783 RepID=UPI0028973BF4|nr:hemolysin XhlA family protein [Enterococcus sp.]